MTYEILRGDQRISVPVKEPVTLEKKLGFGQTAQITFWQGYHEGLSGGYEVSNESLNIRREPLIGLPYKDAGVDNMVTVGPENCIAGEVVVQFAGEEIKVIYQADQ